MGIESKKHTGFIYVNLKRINGITPWRSSFYVSDSAMKRAFAIYLATGTSSDEPAVGMLIGPTANN
jgi:hypothetical protein